MNRTSLIPLRSGAHEKDTVAMKTTLFLGVLCCCLSVAIASEQSYDLSWRTIDGGGAMVTTGGSWELSGTIGQPDAGSMAAGNWELAGGFWPGTVPTSIPHDSDGDVDLDDYVEFFACLNGPGGGIDPTCATVDTDGNRDVDLR